MSEFFRKHRNELGLAVAVLVVVAITATLSETYHSAAGRAETARIIFREAAMLGIFALGAAVVIIAGGIDLSAGSIIAFSGTIFFGLLITLAPDDPGTRWASDANLHFPQTDELALWIPAVALLITLAIAFLVGSFHTWLITVIELPPFVATLASLVGLRSLARLLIQDITVLQYGQRQSTITINDELLTSVSRESWWVSCVLWLVLSGALWVLLSKTIVGRHLYAMGGNEEAARLSGIRTDRLKWLAYCLSSMTAALAGVLYACYIGTTSPATDGMGYELNAIAAAVVGGCSLTGGIGTVAGVILGTLFLRVIIDSVAKLFRSQPDLFEGLVVGMLVVLAVAVNQLRSTGGVRKPYFPGLLGLLNVAIISVLAGVMTSVTSSEAKLRNGLLVAGGTLVILGARAIAERVKGRGSRV
ncbi:MAG: ABC transporter permease [Planctomycetaceae bacterium]|nr:ABC transporter permease [Planctomycetaceae bacterium]